jgi:hypothetical protein
MFTTVFDASREKVLVLGACEKGNDTSNILSLVLFDKMTKERGSNIADGGGRSLRQA